jgi:hypothetical protein
MPPSHHQHRSISPAVSVATMQQSYNQPTSQQVSSYASQSQQPQANVVPNPYSTQKQPQVPVSSLQDLHTAAHIHIPHSSSPPIEHFYFIITTKT